MIIILGLLIVYVVYLRVEIFKLEMEVEEIKEIIDGV